MYGRFDSDFGFRAVGKPEVGPHPDEVNCWKFSDSLSDVLVYLPGPGFGFRLQYRQIREHWPTSRYRSVLDE
jgi:hypothetical protein